MVQYNEQNCILLPDLNLQVAPYIHVPMIQQNSTLNNKKKKYSSNEQDPKSSCGHKAKFTFTLVYKIGIYAKFAYMQILSM